MEHLNFIRDFDTYKKYNTDKTQTDFDNYMKIVNSIKNYTGQKFVVNTCQIELDSYLKEHKESGKSTLDLYDQYIEAKKCHKKDGQ